MPEEWATRKRTRSRSAARDAEGAESATTPGIAAGRCGSPVVRSVMMRPFLKGGYIHATIGKTKGFLGDNNNHE
jgi:hypothetical protein